MQENNENVSAHFDPPPAPNDAKPAQQPLYPELNPWLKNSLLWLGLIFVVAVFFLHNISGYA